MRRTPHTSPSPMVAMGISWPEANKLQADLRQLLIDAGVTLIGNA